MSLLGATIPHGLQGTKRGEKCAADCGVACQVRPQHWGDLSCKNIAGQCVQKLYCKTHAEKKHRVKNAGDRSSNSLFWQSLLSFSDSGWLNIFAIGKLSYSRPIFNPLFLNQFAKIILADFYFLLIFQIGYVRRRKRGIWRLVRWKCWFKNGNFL